MTRMRRVNADVDIVSLFHQVRHGRAYELGQTLKPGIPGSRSHPPFFFSLNRRHGDVAIDGGISAANDVFVMGGHVGTHIDALGHVSRDNRFFDGTPASENQSGAAGLLAHSIDAMPPVIRRGVVLDVASFRGVDALPTGYAATAQDLQDACASQGTEIRTGDVVLIRTGWTRYWDQPDVYSGNVVLTAGVGVDAADWLVERRAALVGADNVAVEPYRFPPQALPVHGRLIADAGVPMIELLNLDQLCADRVYEFLFLALPLRIAGGTGSPIRPIAVI